MNPTRLPNQKHVEIARILNWVLSAIILLMFIVAFWYFFAQIKTWTENFVGQHFETYFQKSPEQIMSIIRSDVIPSIVEVRCSDQDGGPEKIIGSGIYALVGTSSTPTVQTNAHVVLGSDGKFHGCNIYFPRPTDGSFYESSYNSINAFLYHDQVSVVDGVKMYGLDLAQLTLSGPNQDQNGVGYPFPPKAPDLFGAIGKICKKDKTVNIGDKIYIIGYPETGGDSITLTEGVVSGFSDDGQNLIKISASTNHGNSGGIAIGQNDGCYYGIVEAASFEAGSNLGFVMSSGLINQYLSNLTGETVNNLIATTTDPTEYLKKTLQVADLSIKYPDIWDVSTSTDQNTNAEISIIEAPAENALDNFKKAFTLESLDVSGMSADKAMKAKIQEIKTDLNTLKITETKERMTTVGKNTPAYQILFSDSQGSLYNAPSLILDTVVIYKGRLYLLTGVGGSDPNTIDNYINVFQEMVNTIQLR